MSRRVRWMDRWVAWVMVSACTLSMPAMAAAQSDGEEPDTIVVRGEVLSNHNGAPLSGVLVALHDLWKITRTDELGYFEFEGVPEGHHELGVYALGHETLEQYIPFAPDEVLAVKLDLAPVEIEGIEVAILSNSEMEYRSFGTRYDFIGGELMEEYRNKYGQIHDMIRARFPGVRVHDPYGGGVSQTLCVLSTRSNTSLADGNGCAYMLIDGLEADGQQVSDLSPDQIATIRYVSRIEARLVYGDLGKNGVLLIETVSGKRR